MMLRHKFDHGFIDLTNSIFMGEYMNELISEEEVNATLTRSAKIRDTYQQVLEHAKNDTLSHGGFKTGEFYLNYIFNLNLEDVLFQFRDENSIKELPNMEEAFRGYTSFVAFLKALEKPFEEIINSNDFKIRYKSINFREIQKFY
jgi:ribosomal protein L17